MKYRLEMHEQAASKETMLFLHANGSRLRLGWIPWKPGAWPVLYLSRENIHMLGRTSFRLIEDGQTPVLEKIELYEILQSIEHDRERLQGQ